MGPSFGASVLAVELPFLVVHGWWIGKLLVVAAGATGVAVPRWRRRRRERAVISSELLARAADPGGLAEGHSCLRGTLRGRAVSLVPVEGAPGLRWSERSDELALEVADERIALRGPVEVVRGTRAVAGWRRLPRGTPRAITQQAAGMHGRRRLFALGDGDEVIVQGRLSRRPAREVTDYRASRGGWVLEPYDAHGSIAAMAARPAVCPPVLGPRRTALYAVLGGLAAYLVLGAAGAALVARVADRMAPGTDELASVGPLELAAALPNVRASALDELAEQLAGNAPRTEGMMHARFALEELRAGCGAKVALELVEERYEDALAAGCASVDQRLEALVQLGRYREAAVLVPDIGDASSGYSALASIGAGHWADAATAVQAHADRLDHDGHAGDFLRAEAWIHEDCLARWLRAKAGAPVDAEQQPPPQFDVCRILHALERPPPARLKELLGLVDPADNSEDAVLAKSLAWAEGAYAFGPYDLGVGDELFGFDARTWLAPRALAAPDPFPDPVDRAVAHAERARLEVFRGDFPAAQRDAAEAVQLASDAPPGFRQGLAHLVDEIALRAGRTTTGTSDSSLFTGRCADGTLEDALHAATAGDGRPLARALERCEVRWRNAGAILAALPSVQVHRSELAAALRWYRDTAHPPVEEQPFRSLSDAAIHRDLARLAGDQVEATRWQGIVDRQLDVLADPDRLVALLVWGTGYGGE